MLADFGIALAVKEAGGNRLTQTGLSLGTPQYMSPEQATGDRGIDARSDVYSLAAVLYEMLAGEPPVTGRDRAGDDRQADDGAADAPARAARHGDAGARRRGREGARQDAGRPLHQRGRVLARARRCNRSTQQLAAAAPAPASRRAASPSRSASAPSRSRRRWASMRRGRSAHGRTAARREDAAHFHRRRAVSGDLARRQAARLSSRASCTGATCTYPTVVQDVGGTTTRTILDGATAGYNLEWSPDRRNLMFSGTIARPRRDVPPLGARRRRRAGSRAASPTFYAGGDSLLLGPAYRPRLGVLGARRRAGRRAARQHPHRWHGQPPGRALRRAGHELDPLARSSSRRTGSGR